MLRGPLSSDVLENVQQLGGNVASCHGVSIPTKLETIKKITVGSPSS